MDKKNNIVGILIALILSFVITFLTNNPKIFKTNVPTESYRVYLKGESIGLIKSESELNNYINEKQQDLKEKYNVEKIYIPNDINVVKDITYENNLMSVSSIYNIINEKNWIVEGSPRKILKESFGCCDYIIVLDEYTIIRMIRVFKRWINQRSGRESYNSKPTWNFLWCNIKWVLDFNQMKRGLLQELSIFAEKVKIFKHSKEAYEFVIKSFPQM